MLEKIINLNLITSFMRLGLSSATHKDKSLVKVIDRISLLGFKAIEINADQELHDIMLFSEEKLLEVKQKLESTGLKASVHALFKPYSLCDFNETIRKESVEQIKKLVLIMSKIGSGILVVHPGYYQDKSKKDICFNNLIKSVKELLPLLEKTRINLCIENMGHKKGYGKLRLMNSPHDFKSLFRIIKSDFVNITLDAAHAWLAIYNNYCKYDVNEWKELKHKIKHIHLSGFDGTEQHIPVPLTKTIESYDFVYDLIKDFDGIVILENPEETALESLEFLKKKFPKTI